MLVVAMLAIGGAAIFWVHSNSTQKTKQSKVYNPQPYKPNPDKPTNPNIKVEDEDSPINNDIPPPVDIHELPPEEPIQNDHPIDILPDLSPFKPDESEEEIKKECLKGMGEDFWKNHFEPNLAATRYIETSIPHPPRNLPEFVTKFEERAKFTNSEIFTAPLFSSTNNFFGEYTAPLIERKKNHINYSGFRRKADNSLDWIAYKKAMKEPSVVLRSREGYLEMKKFVQEKLNPYLQNLIASFPKINSLTEFNQLLNEYANSMAMGELLLGICLQIAQQLGEDFQWKESFCKSFRVNSPELGKFGIGFFLFDFWIN